MSKKGQKSKKGKGKKRKEVEVAKTAAVFSQFFSKRKKVDNNGADDNDGDDKAGARDEAMRPVDPSPVEGGQRLSPHHTHHHHQKRTPPMYTYPSLFPPMSTTNNHHAGAAWTCNICTRGEEGGKPWVMPCGSALLFPPSHTTRFVLPSCALAVNTRIARTHTYTQLNTTPVANMQHTP